MTILVINADGEAVAREETLEELAQFEADAAAETVRQEQEHKDSLSQLTRKQILQELTGNTDTIKGVFDEINLVAETLKAVAAHVVTDTSTLSADAQAGLKAFDRVQQLRQLYRDAVANGLAIEEFSAVLEGA